MLDPIKVSLLHLFFTVLILGFAIPSTTSRATAVAVKSEASTTPPTVAAVDSRDQVACTMCDACDHPCQPLPPPPPECPPPPPPPPPECPPPPSPPPPADDCPPPPSCSECKPPTTGSIYATPSPPATTWGGGAGNGGYYTVHPPPIGIVPYFPYYSYSPPQASLYSDSFRLEMNAAVLATSLVLSGILYVLHF